MEKVFYKPLQDGWIDVVDSTETLEDGTVIEHTHREDNPAPNTFPKYAEAVKYWCNERGLTVYDRGDYYEFAEPEPEPLPSKEERAKEVRSLRDTRINTVMYVFERDAREKRLGLEPTLKDAQLAEVDRYIQKLCDLPEQAGFPWLNKEIPWPTKPAFLEVK